MYTTIIMIFINRNDQKNYKGRQYNKNDDNNVLIMMVVVAVLE